MAAHKKTTAASWRQDLAAINAAFARLRAIAPGDPAASAPTRRWVDDELSAFEARLGARMPDPARAYALEVGTGGPGFPSGGIRSFDELRVTEAAKKPFPLHKAWSAPNEVDEWKSAGLYAKNKGRFYELREGAKPTDGCVILGATSDNSLLLLVLEGDLAGTVWVDSTGVDLGGVEPAKPPAFLALQRMWVEGELARATREAEILDAAKAGALDALVAKAKAGDDRKTRLKEVACVGYRLLKSHDLSTRAIGLALVRKGSDDSKIARALLEARAWADLAAYARSLLDEEGAHETVKARASVHLVIAVSALHPRDAVEAIHLPDALSYYFPYIATTKAAISGLELARQQVVFNKLPASLVVDLTGGVLGDDDLAPLLPRLLREGFRDLPGWNASRDAAQNLVAELAERTTPPPPDVAEGFARLLAYLGADDREFEELARRANGQFASGASARQGAVAWLLAHRTELVGHYTEWAGPRFDELARTGR